jgi:apolipoprotein N-acyltransferase
VRDGARWLVNLSNDSWLGDAQFSEEALDMSRLRAVEQRRWIVRASTSGPSAVIDPVGRIDADTRPFSQATLSGSIAARDGLTVYARIGDAFALGCALVALAAAIRGRSTR